MEDGTLCRFIGGPWDGLELQLPQNDATEIILRDCRYPAKEFVYCRDRCDKGWVITMESLTVATFRLTKESRLMGDNQRLRSRAKDREEVVDTLYSEIFRGKERIKALLRKQKATKERAAKQRVAKRVSKPTNK